MNRLRTVLTMLGLVIGVAAVVLMMAIGQGAQTLVKEAVATAACRTADMSSSTGAVRGT